VQLPFKDIAMAAYTVVPLGSEIFLVRSLLEPALCQQLIQLTQQNSLANQRILEKISVVQQLLLQVYGVKFPYAEPCTILRYQTGQFYKRHVDNLLLVSRFEELEQGMPTRDISIVGYLNDDFTGGETYFERQDVKVKPEAGAVLVFPAYFTHPHESLPILSGEKYAFTSWLFH
jgi:prolyl 4-hydroxylase